MKKNYTEARRIEIADTHAGRLVNMLQLISNSMKDSDADKRIAELEETVARLTQILDSGTNIRRAA